MACTTGVFLPTPFLQGSKARHATPGTPSHFLNPLRLHGRPLPGRQGHATITAKAAGDNSGTLSGSALKVIKDAWSKSEDRFAIVGLGFAGLAAFRASVSLVAAIDRLPLVPSALEFVGILFSWWFIYRYLLFKPDREELVRTVKKSISDVIGK